MGVEGGGKARRSDITPLFQRDSYLGLCEDRLSPNLSLPGNTFH